MDKLPTYEIKEPCAIDLVIPNHAINITWGDLDHLKEGDEWEIENKLSTMEEKLNLYLESIIAKDNNKIYTFIKTFEEKKVILHYDSKNIYKEDIKIDTRIVKEKIKVIKLIDSYKNNIKIEENKDINKPVDSFQETLDRAAAKVASWPEWKRKAVHQSIQIEPYDEEYYNYPG